VISLYLALFKDGCETHWEIGDKRNAPGFLSTTLGIAALILLLKNLVDYLEEQYQVDFRELDPVDFVSKLEPFINPIVEHFQDPDPNEIKKFKIHRGSTSYKKAMEDLLVIISRSREGFQSEDIEKINAERATTLIKKTAEIWRAMETDLSEIVIKVLKEIYDKNEMDWFYIGVPKKVQESVNEVRNRHVGRYQKGEINEMPAYEECFQMPTDAKDIMDGHQQHFRELFGTADLKWLVELIPVRNDIAHNNKSGNFTHHLQVLSKTRPYIEKAKKALSL